jgi:glyoxylase-like metal-dependent hydrolase (beta-lactamase superfamily II)
VKVAPRIHRVGNGLINVYLLEEAGEVTIVDAGISGMWKEVAAELAAMGRSVDDLRALVLTHAHVDHVGFAEQLRRERRVPVSVHELDARLARGEVTPKNQSLGKIRLPVLRFIWYGVTHGMLRNMKIAEVSTFGDGATLDVPGAPRVIHTPGHSEGSAALYVPSKDALFVGDAFATYNVLSGETGPQIAPFSSDIPRARESLARLERIEAGLVLPGHGEPWTRGVLEALRIIRVGSTSAH